MSRISRACAHLSHYKLITASTHCTGKFWSIGSGVYLDIRRYTAYGKPGDFRQTDDDTNKRRKWGGSGSNFGNASSQRPPTPRNRKHSDNFARSLNFGSVSSQRPPPPPRHHKHQDNFAGAFSFGASRSSPNRSFTPKPHAHERRRHEYQDEQDFGAVRRESSSENYVPIQSEHAHDDAVQHRILDDDEDYFPAGFRADEEGNSWQQRIWADSFGTLSSKRESDFQHVRCGIL